MLQRGVMCCMRSMCRMRSMRSMHGDIWVNHRGEERASLHLSALSLQVNQWWEWCTFLCSCGLILRLNQSGVSCGIRKRQLCLLCLRVNQWGVSYAMLQRQFSTLSPWVNLWGEWCTFLGRWFWAWFQRLNQSGVSFGIQNRQLCSLCLRVNQWGTFHAIFQRQLSTQSPWLYQWGE